MFRGRMIPGVLCIIAALALGVVADGMGDASEDWTTTVKFRTASAPAISDYQGVIEDIVAKAETNDDYQIVLIGHTGTRGPDAANLAMGMRRAEKMGRDLKLAGIAADRIIVLSRGEGETLAQEPHETDALWQKRLNRVEVFVTINGGRYQ